MTSGFPRIPEDPTARFILDLARSLTSSGYTIIVLAPLDAGAAREEDRDGVKVYRFPYFFPEKSMKLAYGEGMLYNIRRSTLAALQVPFFFLFEAITVNACQGPNESCFSVINVTCCTYNNLSHILWKTIHYFPVSLNATP